MSSRNEDDAKESKPAKSVVIQDRDNRPFPPRAPQDPPEELPPTGSSDRDEASGAEMSKTKSKTNLGSTSAILDSALVGDYDLKKSPSTQALVFQYLEKSNLSNFGGLRTSKSLHVLQEKKFAAEAIRRTLKVYRDGLNSIIDDNFWKCFESRRTSPWNWNLYLFPLWLVGVFTRYCILFPIRLVILLVGWIVFGIGMLIAQGCFASKSAFRRRMESGLISMMCGVHCVTWGAVIKYHGSLYEPKEGEPQCVYVANHTSMIDVIILLQTRAFSLVGQRHKGAVGFLQDKAVGRLECVWFDRGEMKKRKVVTQTLSDHARNREKNPLLMFPEGTCVNNEYCIQFKKGAFELGAPALPVAIKYNKMFVDPFWNSRKQSFVMHLVELMTSWCLICDVYFLDPVFREEGESAVDFAARTKQKIARKAGLKDVNWDGYMKHWRPSDRFKKGIQKRLAETFQKVFASCVPSAPAYEEETTSNDDSDHPPSMSPFRNSQFPRTPTS